MAGTSIPANNPLLNPLGSTYDAVNVTNLIRDAIQYAIYDLAPAQYDALKILNMAPVETSTLDEFVYKEMVWWREALTVFGWVNPIITLAGTYAQESDIPVQVNSIICDPAGTPYIVIALAHSAVINSSTITVAVQTGAGALGAGTFVVNDVLSIQGQLIADGMNTMQNPTRTRLVDRYNYIEFFQRTERWDTIQLQKMINAGTTNVLSLEKQEKIRQIRLDLFSTYFNGTRGEFTVIEAAGNKKSKTTGGIYTLMVAGGSSHATVALGGLQTAFEALAFDTNFKAQGAVRFIYGCDELLYELAKAYKEDGIRYAPNDKIADLNLTLYKVGSMQFVPVSCELFRDSGTLPATWANKLLVVDQDTITKKILAGIPAEEMGETDDKRQGAYMDYKYWWVAAQIGLQMNNVMGSFYIDVT